MAPIATACLLALVFLASTAYGCHSGYPTTGRPEYDTCPGEKGFGNGAQLCGYVTVREGAHIFWWLYKTDKWIEKPLIMWLSGGPGGSSTGHGNFGSIGPQTIHQKNRTYNWMQDFNILLVDAPVGAGFSYVDHLKYLADNNTIIATDLVNLTRAVFEKVQELRGLPFYVYGDGYGGKIAADYIRHLIDDTSVRTNLKGLALGNVWASPIHNVLSYAPYLYEVSLIDETQRDGITEQAEFTKSLCDLKEFYHCSLEWVRTLDTIYRYTDGIDFGNFLTKLPNTTADSDATYYQLLLDKMTYSRYYTNFNNDSAALNELMNGAVRDALKIPANVTWGKQGADVFENLFVDFMKSVVSTVENLLNTTDVEIHICNGNLDIMVDTPGQFSWINNMVWPNRTAFGRATRTTVWAEGHLEGYQKKGGRLAFYWMNVAGVDFINENPLATRAFLKAMTTY